jgi:hypothetical protein
MLLTDKGRNPLTNKGVYFEHFHFYTEDNGFECSVSTIHHGFPGLELTIVLTLSVICSPSLCVKVTDIFVSPPPLPPPPSHAAEGCGFTTLPHQILLSTLRKPEELHKCTVIRHFLFAYTAKTQDRKFKANIHRKENARLQSQILHSCICERFIYSSDRFAYSFGGK